MPGSEIPRPFDIVVLPFPYSDRLAEKRRPGLVLSEADLAREYGLVWVAMITSARNASWDCDVPIPEMKAAGLPFPSVVRPAKIATVEVTRIVRIAGRIEPDTSDRVRKRVLAILDETPR